MKQTYLDPVIIRRGLPIMTSVMKLMDGSCYLNTYHNLKSIEAIYKRVSHKSCYKGMDIEYWNRSSSRISQELYDAFIAESKRNHKIYVDKSKKEIA